MGLKLGDPLSPLSFVLFIDDIRQDLPKERAEGTNGGTSIEQLSIFLILFADNMVLFSDNPVELQIL